MAYLSNYGLPAQDQAAWTLNGWSYGPGGPSTNPAGTIDTTWASRWGSGVTQNGIVTYQIYPALTTVLSGDVAAEGNFSQNSWVPLVTTAVDDFAIPFWGPPQWVPTGLTASDISSQVTNGAPLCIQFQYPCVVSFSWVATAPQSSATPVTVFGYDMYGQLMQDTFTVGTSVGTVGPTGYLLNVSKKAFWGITGIYVQDDLDDTTVSAYPLWGLPFALDDLSNVIAANIYTTPSAGIDPIAYAPMAGKAASPLSVVQTAATDDVRGIFGQAAFTHANCPAMWMISYIASAANPGALMLDAMTTGGQNPAGYIYGNPEDVWTQYRGETVLGLRGAPQFYSGSVV